MISVIRSSACRTKSRTILSGVGANEILLDCFDGTLYESSLRMTSRFQSYCIRGALIKAKPIGVRLAICDATSCEAAARVKGKRLLREFYIARSPTPKAFANSSPGQRPGL